VDFGLIFSNETHLPAGQCREHDVLCYPGNTTFSLHGLISTTTVLALHYSFKKELAEWCVQGECCVSRIIICTMQPYLIQAIFQGRNYQVIQVHQSRMLVQSNECRDGHGGMIWSWCKTWPACKVDYSVWTELWTRLVTGFHAQFFRL